MRELKRTISATVLNRVKRIAYRVSRETQNAQRAILATAIVAILVFFACLGLMYVPGIVVSGLTSITCALFAPVDKEGGIS